MATLTNRHEILFLYDASWINPNGDPLDENKPRYDEATGLNLVSDVRLKRTVRDELVRIGEREGKGDWVFVRGIRKEDGKLQSKDERLKARGIDSAEKVLSEFIDIRLFGATIAIKNSTYTWTGPVQFKMGYSLHPVEVIYLEGNTVMPSGEGKGQGTFRSEHVVRYSLIVFYGIANENSAEETGLTDDDLDYMFRAMWYGTKNLITRSKVGQMPRLLLDVEWKGGNWHLGELDKYVKAEVLRTPTDLADLKLSFKPLIDILNLNFDKIYRLRYALDPRFTEIHGNPFEELKGNVRIECFDWL